jgi:hypothetical protein
MTYIGAAIEDYVVVNGLGVLHTQATHIRISVIEPNTYAIATGSSIGNKNWGAGAAFATDVAGTPSGRQVLANPITNGAVTADGMATWWAATDEVNGRLLAHGQLSAPTQVFNGYTFTLPSFLIKIPAQ